ncbi:MAG TPA: hypothetical protein V6D29_19440 [Leptolyngbyaceae cyanobacterium]
MAIADPRQEIEQVQRLLTQYFDLGTYEVNDLVEGWLQHFDLLWVHNAVIEALYQGRYKVVSVEQILRFWQRRGQPLRHFSREFESIIYGETLRFSQLPVSKEVSQAESQSLPHFPENPFFPQSWQSRQTPVNQERLDSPTEEVEENQADAVRPEKTLEDEGLQTSPEAPSDCLISSEEGLSIEPFKPTAQPPIKPENWIYPSPGMPQSRSAGHSEPIQTFIPDAHPSELHERLQAVARQSVSSQGLG